MCAALRPATLSTTANHEDGVPPSPKIIGMVLFCTTSPEISVRSGSTKVNSSPLVWASPNQISRAVTPPRSMLASSGNVTSGARNTAPASNSLFCGDMLLNMSIISCPCFSISSCCFLLRIRKVPGVKPGSPAACSGWKCVVLRKSVWLLGASLAATRAAVAPFFVPRPVSTTSVARLPTTIAILGKPMMAQTWSDICVVFSPTRGICCANAPTPVRAASATSLVYDFIVLRCTTPGFGLGQVWERKGRGVDALRFARFSKDQFERELNLPWLACFGGDLSGWKVRAAPPEVQSIVRKTVLVDIENIEKLRSELKAHSLTKLDVLQQREVKILESGASHGISAQVAECSGRLQRIATRVEPLIDFPDDLLASGNIVGTRHQGNSRAAGRLVVAV